MLGSKFLKFLVLILKRQFNFCPNFEPFFIVMTYNLSKIFKLIHSLHWIKGSHQRPKFETFECPGQNLPNSSCIFWKHNSIFLQIFHQYSVPSNIALLYFFTSNVKYFCQKQPIKAACVVNLKLFFTD